MGCKNDAFFFPLYLERWAVPGRYIAMEKPKEKAGGVELMPRQRQALDAMVDREASEDGCRGGIMCHEVGFGKTYVVLSLCKQSERWPVLLMVPKTLIYQWVDAVHDVDGRSGVLTRALQVWQSHDLPRGGRAPAISQGGGDGELRLVLTTHSCAVGPAMAGALRQVSWGRVILDEAHAAKNPRSRLGQLTRSLRSFAVWAVTATPMQNGRGDLFSLARMVGVDTQDVEVARSVCLDHERDVAAAAAPPASSEVVDVRTLRLEPALDGIEAEALAESMDDYRAAAERAERADGGGGGGKLVLQAMLRSRLAATHPYLYYSSLARSRRTDPLAASRAAERASEALAGGAARASTKFRFALDDFDECGESSAVFFCEWIDEMDLLSDAFGERSVETIQVHGMMASSDREAALDDFCTPLPTTTTGRPLRRRVLLCQIRCGGCGLNLQHAASRVYLMRPNWNPAWDHQAIGRVSRPGQSKRVVALRLVICGSVDELSLERQASKLDDIAESTLVDRMRRLLVADDHSRETTGKEGEDTTLDEERQFQHP